MPRPSHPPRTRPALTVDLDRRLCLRCGYRGRLLQGDRGRSTFTCPSCSCDLYARPPKSYAELEGLHENPEDAPFADFWSIPGMDIPIEPSAPHHPRFRCGSGTRLDVLLIVGVACAVGMVMIGRVFFMGS